MNLEKSDYVHQNLQFQTAIRSLTKHLNLISNQVLDSYLGNSASITNKTPFSTPCLNWRAKKRGTKDSVTKQSSSSIYNALFYNYKTQVNVTMIVF